jgi:hypothetical protein
MIMMQWQDDKSARCFLMNSNDNSWSEAQLTGIPHGYIWTYPAIDQASDKVFFEQGYMENDQLIMNVLVGRMNGSIAVRDGMEKKWSTDKKTVFGETGSNVRLGEPGMRDWPSLGVGIINGSDMYIPYCVDGQTDRDKTIYGDEGPFNNGVFHSDDSGINWKMEKLSDFEAWLSSLCKTKDYYYYLAVRNHQQELWFARKPTESSSWDAPKVITTTFCNSALYWKYVATADDDTIHLCWLDRRHEKTSFNLDDSSRHNYDVVYCNRKDAENKWSKDIVLSKNLPYSYTPAMSVEGNEVVIVWAGAAKDDRLTDIYYVTSKDGGKTWAEPLKVTDDTKNGITTGEPQVMMLNGVIHLFYIQGKMDLQQVGGLTKLNQPPWPIYYTQRPFPN